MSKPRLAPLRWLILPLLLLLAWWGREHWDMQQLTQSIVESVAGLGIFAPLAFMVLYALATVLLVPGLLLTLAGGALFGPWWGTAYNLFGATLGAYLSFVLARYSAADWVEARMGSRLQQVKRGVEREGWRFVAFTRLVPLFPFNVLNYALGLTRIRTRDYVVTSALCMLPAAFAYTWLGYAGRAALSGEDEMLKLLLIAAAVLGVLLFVPRLVAAMRRGPMLSVDELQQKLEAGEECLLIDVRTEAERHGELGHLAQARHLVLDQLPQRIDTLSEWAEKPVYVLCRTDVRSAKAARLLTRHGFADVHVVQGGMQAWNQAGFPVKR